MMVQFDVKRVQKGTESFMVSFDFAKTPVTQIADYIIISASKHNASDIHFDPREEGMMVRFRIDGDCQDYTFVPKAYERNLTTRLKLLANMNITESRLPQDGAIKGMFGDTYLDMRVSALPLNQGEKIVIRILDYTRSLQGIDSLGFHPKNLEKIKRMMGLPNGIILTTGATGSGKSTTTYSILQGLNKPETNVITVEDPIEMNIEGINQVQVNAEIGMTFAAALRSILRQDPNVILIGEIRDAETAQIAVRASITGHLVLSTIHTNNALATVERLLDMDVERYLLSTALSGIISQRLAKMLCPDCRYQRETTKYEKKVFKKYMHMDVATVWDANPHGCDHCRRGYHGRIAVHEVLELTDEIRNAINNENLEKEDLAKMVYDGGTITMLQDALIKCLEGKTTFEEVYRTIEIENEDDDNYENEIATEIKDTIPEAPPEISSDDLLDDGTKKNTENDISNVIEAPAFTAADFMSEEEKKEAGLIPAEEEKKEGDKAKEGEEAKEGKTKPATPEKPTAQPVAPVQPVAKVQSVGQAQPQSQTPENSVTPIAQVLPVAAVAPVASIDPSTQTKPAAEAQTTLNNQPIVQTAAQNSMGTESVQKVQPVAPVNPVKPIK
ncbi:MAG: Flp pilus assembly complex ATPase component TadA [Bacilli bacterium]|nr:Flp pilus assembly complex ATPase component TadA [Bacilli bacterium]